MTIDILINKLNFPKEVKDKVFKILNSNELDKIKPTIYNLMNERMSKEVYNKLCIILSYDPYSIKMLTCYLLCAIKVYDEYKKKNISDKIFFDTMNCFPRFINESYEKTKEYTFDRGWWTYRQVNMTLFRIGELEYEFINNDEKVISIHIPSDANMTNEKVDESIIQAKEFINNHYNEYKSAKFICESWLLSPSLKLILKRDSNILNFQNRFNIISTKDDMGYIEWIFKRPKNTIIDELPENTSLQKKAKDMLLKNQLIGSGFGILK